MIDDQENTPPEDPADTQPATRTDDDGKDNLGRQGLADQAKGKLNEVAGNAQQKLGELTGNEDAQADGADRAMEGKIQQGAGTVERTTDDLLDR